MNESGLPLLIEPEALEQSLGSDRLLVVDVSRPDNYRKVHVPGAVHLDYVQIVAVHKPVLGLLPDAGTLASLFSATGIGHDTHVVACDDEGGGRAARLLWTLEACGHRHYSLLNGGLHAWANEGHRFESGSVTHTARDFTVHYNDAPVADGHYVQQHLGDPDTCLLDVRSAAEYSGAKRLAARAGHIPGAVHLEWTQAIDCSRNLRLPPADELRALFAHTGATPGREIVVYCQSHHRSAHTWLVLKYLGYPRVRGFHGAWSEWGNNPALPVETGQAATPPCVT